MFVDTIFLLSKCGVSKCDICGPPCLPESVFSSLHTLPDPMPDEEGHYKKFADLYGTKTTESHDFMFTCGAPFQELTYQASIADLYVKDISCEDSIERMYYAAKYPPICVHCACSMPESDAATEHYPQCSGCSQKPNILK